MARGDAVIDIDIDPFAERASRWRTLLRIGVPVLGVALTIAAILAIALYTDQAYRRGALALSEDVLTALDGRSANRWPAILVQPSGRWRSGNSLPKRKRRASGES